jgi:PHD/YefM family antitoxin component YafN of YafNO toxin-antitoxin module
MDKTMPLVEARDALGQRVDAAHYADEATVITKNGNPRAVLISFEWFQTLSADLRQTAGANGADLGQTANIGQHGTARPAAPDTGADQRERHAATRSSTTQHG